MTSADYSSRERRRACDVRRLQGWEANGENHRRVDGIVLIENVAAFLQLRNVATTGQSALLAETGIAQAHGFRGAARRIRRRDGVSIYYASPALCSRWAGSICSGAKRREVSPWRSGAISTTAGCRYLRHCAPFFAMRSHRSGISCANVCARAVPWPRADTSWKRKSDSTRD